jgi:O-antigen/teichoic acid export membrane protein
MRLRRTIHPLGLRFAKAGLWNLIGNGFSQVSNLAAQILIARYLGKGLFGELGAVYGTLLTIGIFCGLGLGLAVTRSIAELRDIEPERVRNILRICRIATVGCSVGIAIVVALAARSIATHILNAPELGAALLTGCALIPLSAYNALQVSILAGFEAFKRIALLNVIKGVSAIPLLLAGARIAGVGGVVAAYVITNALYCAVAGEMLRREAPSLHCGGQLDRSEVMPLIQFAGPALLNSALWPLTTWATNMFVIRLDSGFDKLGLLNAARQWQAVTNFIPVALNSAVMPILASVFSTTPAESGRSLRYASLLCTVAVWPVALTLMIAAPFLIRLYGDAYRPAWPIFIILIGATGVNLLNSPVGSLVLARGRMLASLVNSLSTSIFALTATLLIITRWQLVGLGYVTLLCNAASTVGIVWYGVKVLEFPRGTGRAIIASSLAMAVATVVIHVVYQLSGL